MKNVLKAVVAYAILIVLALLAINTLFVVVSIIFSRAFAIETLNQNAYEQLMIRLFNSWNPITKIMANRELNILVRIGTAITTMASPFIFFYGVRKYNSRKK